MQKNYFHNGKFLIENINQKKTNPIQLINQKENVDINKLLNKVRINNKNESKKKTIFYSSTLLALAALSFVVF
ncbi:hypothetical protein N8824_00730 [Candidatus Pelagibacter sp.]|nr:hypothetical protein [Candidatus Pelagibacter sp.]